MVDAPLITLAVGGLLALLLVAALWGYYTDPKLHKWPARDWAADIRAQYQPGDVIFYTAKLLPSWWYLYDLPSYFLADNETEPNSGFNLSNAASAALGMKLVDTGCLVDTRCLGEGTKRVFVVYAKSPATTSTQEQAYRLLKQHPVISHTDFVNDGQVLTGSVTLVEWR